MNLLQHSRTPFISGVAAYRRILFGLAALLLVGTAVAAEVDPPDRVARLAFLSGDVTFAPAGKDRWNEVSINRPLVTGDRLLTGRGARVAMDLGGGDIRIGADTRFNFLSLDNNNTQIELNQGTLNWRVDKLEEGQTYEVDTPTVAFVISQPGEYRIDVPARGGGTTISVRRGAGTVYGKGGANYPLSGRQSWSFGNAQLTDVAGEPLPDTDKFDRWCADRDERMHRGASSRYVSSAVVGYSDLDDNGSWDDAADYGPVWYPRAVVAGWAPYRYGHWTWIAPWGWTWIDDAPWGFAPFHYGRWVYVRERWGWAPGPVYARPVYCPALVAFVGGGGWSVSVNAGRPIGWVPLGPRDVYVPWYHGSRRYFNDVNVSNVVNINQTNITNVYDNTHGKHRTNNVTYMHQSVPGATTVVTHDTFAHGRAVGDAQVNLDQAQLAKAPAMLRPDVPAGRPGLGLRQSADANEAPSAVFARPLVSHRAPPDAALEGRRPRAEADTRPLRADEHGDARGRNETRLPNPGNAVDQRHDRGTPERIERPQPSAPEPATSSPQAPAAERRPDAEPSLRPGEMPSSRFVPRRGNRGAGGQPGSGTLNEDPRPGRKDAPAARAESPLSRDIPGNDSQGPNAVPRDTPQRAPEERPATPPLRREQPVEEAPQRGNGRQRGAFNEAPQPERSAPAAARTESPASRDFPRNDPQRPRAAPQEMPQRAPEERPAAPPVRREQPLQEAPRSRPEPQQQRQPEQRGQTENRERPQRDRKPE
jgi:hypothetical protein